MSEDKQTLTDWLKTAKPDDDADPDTATIPGYDTIGDASVYVNAEGQWRAQVMSQWDTKLRKIQLASAGYTKRQAVAELAERIDDFLGQMQKASNNLFAIQQGLEKWVEQDIEGQKALGELTAEAEAEGGYGQ